MERILKAFKDLYRCDEVKKRHFLYVLLLILPSILGGFASWVDKETPKEALPMVLAFVALFALLSIVPLIFLMGFSVDFNRDRLNAITGIPKVNTEMFEKGLKILPLIFVWGIYYLIYFGLFFVAPIVAIVAGCIALSGNVAGIVGLILIGLLLLFLSIIVSLILSPFLNYIIFNFSKDLVYRAEYFNPLTLVRYIKKSFKSTMMVFLKMILANMVVGTVSQIVGFIFILFAMVFPIIFALFAGTEEAAEKAVFSPASILLTLPFTTIAALIQSYATGIVQFAATDMYVEVYKNEIEPTENEI